MTIGLRRAAACRVATACERADAGGCQRSLLHVATDHPGNFPNGPEIVRALARAGADVNARAVGPHEETPLHWAASTDDAAVIDTLLDLGAELEAPGSVIDGTTALADAAAFGQWRAARRLLEHGAHTNLWQAAALGLTDRVRHLLEAGASADEMTNAMWCACHGGQRAAAELLLEHGADSDWVGHDGLTALDAAEHSHATELAAWLRVTRLEGRFACRSCCRRSVADPTPAALP